MDVSHQIAQADETENSCSCSPPAFRCCSGRRAVDGQTSKRGHALRHRHLAHSATASGWRILKSRTLHLAPVCCRLCRFLAVGGRRSAPVAGILRRSLFIFYFHRLDATGSAASKTGNLARPRGTVNRQRGTGQAAARSRSRCSSFSAAIPSPARCACASKQHTHESGDMQTEAEQAPHVPITSSKFRHAKCLPSVRIRLFLGPLLIHPETTST